MALTITVQSSSRDRLLWWGPPSKSPIKSIARRYTPSNRAVSSCDRIQIEIDGGSCTVMWHVVQVELSRFKPACSRFVYANYSRLSAMDGSRPQKESPRLVVKMLCGSMTDWSINIELFPPQSAGVVVYTNWIGSSVKENRFMVCCSFVYKL